MDTRLLGWARALAARTGRRVPPLWLFTDARRLPDPCGAIARLPPGLAGVVLRHDGEPGRVVLGCAIARICRARRLALVVAGDTRLALALRAGTHLRSGRWPSVLRTPRRPITSSAHSAADLVRARRSGVALVFLSPAFPTPSHPDAVALGPTTWTRQARLARLPVAALGGIDGNTVRRLPRRYCWAVGAIGALS